MYSHPLGKGFLLRPAIEYDHLSYGDTWITAEGALQSIEAEARVYTLRAGVGYAYEVTPRFSVLGEAGAGYSRFEFEATQHTFNFYGRTETAILQYDPEHGLSTWVALVPSYEVTDRIDLGLSVGYRAAFMGMPDEALDEPYNRQLHALVMSLSAAYRL